MSVHAQFRTERLLLRRFRDEDRAAYAALSVGPRDVGISPGGGRQISRSQRASAKVCARRLAASEVPPRYKGEMRLIQNDAMPEPILVATWGLERSRIPAS